jgi:hypothetical protein
MGGIGLDLGRGPMALGIDVFYAQRIYGFQTVPLLCFQNCEERAMLTAVHFTRMKILNRMSIFAQKRRLVRTII